MDILPRCIGALACALLLPCLPVSAADLSRETAVRLAIAHHPALREESAQRESAAAQAALDALPPADTFGAELENVAGTGDLSAVGGAEATLRFGRTIERGGKREARVQRGNALLATHDAAAQRRRLDIAAEASRRWYALLAAEAALAQAVDGERLAGEMLATVETRVRRGVAPQADAPQARIARVRAELAREHAEHELLDARMALGSWIGAAPDDAPRADGDLFELPPLPDFEVLAARLPAAANAGAAAREFARIEAEGGVARAAAAPDWTVGVGVRRVEALDDQALVLSFSMPLGTAVRADRALARLDAEERVVAARSEVALLEARRELHRAVQELRHARTEFEAIDARMIPAAEESLAFAREGYEAARYSLLQLSTAESALADLRRARVEAAARYQALAVDIRRLVAAEGELP